ncbi:unnamed protein product [Chondrus crispus]|uniref:Uncharacterized protein n=1 Tax=Chondrus crispus TaxID=2769 RepID=R7QKM3_CHOCR|nr:unnamed protein product [Chondrus crispus]CDF39062.1 unnamed protein product [Chondrus crispus]|eukprot:XP_005718973.1 unnamed protein product [Chondrus crispus]
MPPTLPARAVSQVGAVMSVPDKALDEFALRQFTDGDYAGDACGDGARGRHGARVRVLRRAQAHPGRVPRRPRAGRQLRSLLQAHVHAQLCARYARRRRAHHARKRARYQVRLTCWAQGRAPRSRPPLS